jgi:hypothetical protein
VIVREPQVSAARPEPAAPVIADIVVTAQRRPESQQTVPISLTAFGREEARDYRLQTLRDVSRLTPGLLVSNFSVASPIIAVRGATNTSTRSARTSLWAFSSMTCSSPATAPQLSTCSASRPSRCCVGRRARYSAATSRAA